jgi:hippurate hydrolase
MGGEDFAWYLQGVPGCYVRFGARRSDSAGFPAHSSRFEIDEQVLATGAAWFAEVARLAGASLAGLEGGGRTS